jgi:hypothetical protein
MDAIEGKAKETPKPRSIDLRLIVPNIITKYITRY